ncbi:MAG: hypothetical protein WDO68_04060 [Gammaproteobacteria bacterium]
MPESATSVDAFDASDPDHLLAQGALWPWIARFLWSPAVDLHPSHRALLLPGWPMEAWTDRAVLAHFSRHLLVTHGLLAESRWDTGSAGFRVAVLPLEPLTRLARRIGFTLHGPAPVPGSELQEDDDPDHGFLSERAPLYWRASHVTGDDPEGTGWHAVRLLAGDQPAAIRQRLQWKTPASGGRPAQLPDTSLLWPLARKILREFEEPWSSLFGTLRRPARQIRLCG